jgi:hypothetical protein
MKVASSNPALLTRSQVLGLLAQATGVRPKTVACWLRAGLVLPPAVVFSAKSQLWSRSAVEDFLAGRKGQAHA